MTTLDKKLDKALHPERNGVLIARGIAEGANHEHIIKESLKSLIEETVMEIIGEDEPANNSHVVGSDHWMDDNLPLETRYYLRLEQRQKAKELLHD